MNKFKIITEICQRKEIDHIFLSPNVLKFNLSNNMNKFIIFEPQEIYTSVQSLFQFSKTIHKINWDDVPVNHIHRLPFFAGYSNYDLSEFLFGNDSLKDDNFSIEINFEIFPADFNTLGLERFLRYIYIVQNAFPIFNGGNHFSKYREVFTNEIKKYNGKYEYIIPQYLIELDQGAYEEGPITTILKDSLE